MGDFQSGGNSTPLDQQRDKHHKKRGAAEVYLCVSGGLDKEDPPYRVSPRMPRPESCGTMTGLSSGPFTPKGRVSIPPSGLTGQGELGNLGGTMNRKLLFSSQNQ